MKLDDFSPIEQLAIAQGLYKTLAETVSTKDPDSMRSRMDADVVEAYVREGIKSRDVRLCGEKVGTYSVRVSKAKREHVLRETDHEAFVKWAGENPEICTLFAIGDPAKLAKFALDTAGEIPDGFAFEETTTPETVSGTTLKVDSQLVADALGNSLPNAVTGFIEGGD